MKGRVISHSLLQSSEVFSYLDIYILLRRTEKDTVMFLHVYKLISNLDCIYTTAMCLCMWLWNTDSSCIFWRKTSYSSYWDRTSYLCEFDFVKELNWFFRQPTSGPSGLGVPAYHILQRPSSRTWELHIFWTDITLKCLNKTWTYLNLLISENKCQELAGCNSKLDTVKTASLSISYHKEKNYSSFIDLCYATKANRNVCHLSFLFNNSYILLFHSYLTK